MLLNPRPSKSAKCHIREHFGKYEKTSVVILQERSRRALGTSLPRLRVPALTLGTQSLLGV